MDLRITSPPANASDSKTCIALQVFADELQKLDQWGVRSFVDLVLAQYGDMERNYWERNNQPGLGVFMSPSESEDLANRLHQVNACSSRAPHENHTSDSGNTGINTTLTQNNRTLRLGMCVIQHSSGPFLQEWLVHHLSLGFDHVVFLDNSQPNSPESRSFREAVQSFVNAGVAEVWDWYFEGKNNTLNSDTFMQGHAYQVCLDRVRQRFDWVAFFDMDEYLLINPPLSPCIKDILATSPISSWGALGVKWRFMLPYNNGRHNFSRPLLEQNTKYVPFINDHVKLIVNVELTESLTNPHHVTFNDTSVIAADFEGFPLDQFQGSAYREDQYDHLELRHFWCRSLEDCIFDKLCGMSFQRRTRAPIRASILASLISFDKVLAAGTPEKDIQRIKGVLMD